jgi:hypothetical protein
VTRGEERSRWKIHADRIVDQNPHIRLSIASVELPDGTRFDQYVARLSRCAMTVVLDEDAERMLLIWRHRFIRQARRTVSPVRIRPGLSTPA